MSRSLSRKSVAVLGAVALLAAGAAYAYFTQSGSGSGSAATGTTTPITVNQTSVVTGLYPGEPGVELEGTFTNPNAGAVRVATVTAAIGTIAPVGCAAANYTITDPTYTVNANVPAGTGVGSWGGGPGGGPVVSMVDTGSNQDVCKNAVVNLTYTSN